jgi:hypothetical protein
MQPELTLHDVELTRGRILERHPDKALLTTARPAAVLAHRDVANFSAVLVEHAVDEHGADLDAALASPG